MNSNEGGRECRKGRKAGRDRRQREGREGKEGWIVRKVLRRVGTR